MFKKNVIKLVVISYMLGLTACSQTPKATSDYPKKSLTVALHGAVMTDTCLEHAAVRYNMMPQRIRVLGVDSFEGSYEMRGYTPRQEAFTCAFDDNGKFLYLAMR